MKRTALITGLALACLIHLSAQQDIASARAMGVGASVTISGIITNGDELGTIRYMQDHTGGIAVYSSEMSSVQRGDSVTVNGTLKDYSSLLEVVLDPGQFGEQYEGMLVRVDQATISASGLFQRNAYGFTSDGETGREVQRYMNNIPVCIDISQLNGGFNLLHITLTGGDHIIRKITIH